MGNATRNALLLLTLTLLMPAVCQADGAKFPERYVKTLPAIPNQRAIVVHHDGEEQLIIESSLEGEGPDFAWIVPIPAEPTKLEVASAGFIKTLSVTLGPEVMNGPGRLDALEIAAILTAFWFALLVVGGIRSRGGALVVGAPILVLAVIIIPQATRLMGSKGETMAMQQMQGMEGVRVAQSARVGSYDVSVLDADTPAALNAWLDTNGFAPVPPEGESIVQDYIDQEWRFVSAKIHRESREGYSEPHPIAMTFPSEAPIYPMRLTALSGSDLYLELFVIAEERATHRLLQREIADRFAEDRALGARRRAGEEFTMAMFGELSDVSIGHPEALRMMWKDCMLTKLAGTLQPEDMRKDIELTLEPDGPTQLTLWTKEGTSARTLGWALWGWCIGLPVLVVTFLRVGRTRVKAALFRLSLGAGLAVACLLVQVAGAALLPKAPKDEYEIAPRLSHAYTDRLEESLAELAGDGHAFAGWTVDEIGHHLERALRAKTATARVRREGMDKQPTTALSGTQGRDALPRYEDSPGNFTVWRDREGHLVIRTYGRGGTPQDTAVGEDGKSRIHVLLEKRARE